MREFTEPHFDDERTLLTARPVVPLEKINAKVRHRRLWFLAGAFAIAMMLGAGSALLAFYFKQRNAPQTVTTQVVAQPETAPEEVVVAESVPSETPVVEDQSSQTAETLEEEDEVPPPVTPKRESVARHRTVAPPHNAEPIDREDTRQLSEEDELERIRQAVLYDQWQERRARRVRRERRRAERYNHRDLSNLNEIFEGRRP